MTAEASPQGQTQQRGPGYEVRDTNVKVVVTFIVGLFVFLAFCEFAIMGLLKVLRTPGAESFTPEAPDVIAAQLRRLRTEESNVLAGTAPAGKNSAETIHIPIDRAIELLAERGIPPIPGPLKTEAEVNGHSGTPAPAPPAASDKPAQKTKEAPK
jgi:hypothetical protein